METLYLIGRKVSQHKVVMLLVFVAKHKLKKLLLVETWQTDITTIIIYTRFKKSTLIYVESDYNLTLLFHFLWGTFENRHYKICLIAYCHHYSTGRVNFVDRELSDICYYIEDIGVFFFGHTCK